MKKLILFTTFAVSLTGCAQWNNDTPYSTTCSAMTNTVNSTITVFCGDATVSYTTSAMPLTQANENAVCAYVCEAYR